MTGAAIGAGYAFLAGCLVGALIIGFVLDGRDRVLYGRSRCRQPRR